MSWLSLIEIAINVLLQSLAQLKPGTSSADAKLASEITAAIERLKAVHADVVSQPGLEALRTKPLW